jgi:hypothetical protein
MAVPVSVCTLVAALCILFAMHGKQSREVPQAPIAAEIPPIVIVPDPTAPAPISAVAEPPAQSPAPVESKGIADSQEADRTVPAPTPRVKELEREVAELRSHLKSGNTPDRAAADPVRRRFVPPPSRTPTATASGPVTSMVAVPAPSLDAPGSVMAAKTLWPVFPSVPAVAPPPAPAAVAKAAGRLIWTGSLKKGALLFIDEARPSSGSLTGKLPGGPVRFTIHSGELTEGGMLVYSADQRFAGRSESPRAANGWNHTIYEYDPKRLRDIEVMEAPRSDNAWRKVVLRVVNRPVGLIIVDWERP